MQKWEYLKVETANGSMPYSLNGVAIKDWKKGPNIFEFIGQLGDEGWEMLTAPVDTNHFFWFKRPKV